MEKNLQRKTNSLQIYRGIIGCRFPDINENGSQTEIVKEQEKDRTDFRGILFIPFITTVCCKLVFVYREYCLRTFRKVLWKYKVRSWNLI